MSQPLSGADAVRPAAEEPRRIPEELRRYLRPREGWVAYFLLFVMLLTVGWSVQRAGWLEQAEFLIPVAFYASLLGALLGMSRLSVAITLPISAFAGAAVTLWSVGGEYFPDQSQLDRLLNLRTDAIDWTSVVVKLGYPVELSPYALGLAAIMWVTAFIAAYTLYRHHRALDAIVLVGAALVANMSATFTDLFFYLVIFVLAALFLWLRVALLNREDGWRRRRVTETPEVSASIMRTGAIFIVTTIVLSWMLTSVAVGAPLTDAWRNLDTVWTSARNQLDGVFGSLTCPDCRLSGSTFSASFAVKGSWVSDDSEVMTVAEKHNYYLETITYDVYTGKGWKRTEAQPRTVGANQFVFPGYTPDRPQNDKTGATLEKIQVVFNKTVGRNLFTPGFPSKLDTPSVVQLPGGAALMGGLEATAPIPIGAGYTLNALIANATEAQLTAAGTNYPAEVVKRYLGVAGVTQRTKDLARLIASQASATDPYHEAKALADYLRTDPSLTYTTKATLPRDANQDIVDFFLFDPAGQRGYCQYFASAMVVMARSLGLPARMAVGFAPGSSIGTEKYLYREKNAHTWAEVYFPGYGWQIFEATKTIAAVFRSSGDPNASGPIVGSSPPPNTGAGFKENQAPDQPKVLPSVLPIVGSSGGDTGEVRGGNLVVLAVILLGVSAVIGWRLRIARRRLRFLAPGDRQWRLLLMAADRAGVRQRPSETDYEYAGWLEDQIPARRPEIREIADGKVWGSYSGRGMTAETVSRMEAAWQRLRRPLVTLAIRRRLRAFFLRRATS
jgi:transglutaminase-like putative cysteine protease